MQTFVLGLVIGIIIGMIIAYLHSFHEYKQIKKVWKSANDGLEKSYKELADDYINFVKQSTEIVKEIRKELRDGR